MKFIGFESKKFSCNVVLVGYDEFVLRRTLRCSNKKCSAHLSLRGSTLIRSSCVQPAYLLKKINMNTFEKIIALNRFFYRTSIDIQTVIDGKFQFSGKLLLDGMVNGELEGRNHENTTAVVGPTGKVNGDIKCRTIMVAGTVYGDVYAETVFLMEGARIFGDLHYDKLEVDYRAVVNGRFVLRGESAESRLPSFTKSMQFIPKVEVGMNLPIAGI